MGTTQAKTLCIPLLDTSLDLANICQHKIVLIKFRNLKQWEFLSFHLLDNFLAGQNDRQEVFNCSKHVTYLYYKPFSVKSKWINKE